MLIFLKHCLHNELVFQMQILLQTWPKLEPEQALELLDYTFADQAVRRLAVECIEKMRSELLPFTLLVEFFTCSLKYTI